MFIFVTSKSNKNNHLKNNQMEKAINKIYKNVLLNTDDCDKIEMWSDNKGAYITFKNGDKNVAKIIDNGMYVSILDRIEEVNILGHDAVLILIGVAKKLNFSQSKGFSGISFYKNIDNKKMRIANHGQSAKWMSIYGDSENLLILDEKTKLAEALELVNNLNLNLYECLEIGKIKELEDYHDHLNYLYN